MTGTHRACYRPAAGLALALLGALAVSVLAVPEAEARRRPRASSFSANKTFGLGVMVGAPTALSGKLYLGADTALDFGLGVIRGFGDDGFHFHMDFLWHPVSLVNARPFVIPLYLGIGGRVFSFDYDDDFDEDYFRLGARAPVGLALDFNNVPLDIFFELALVLDVIGHDVPDASLQGALGLRFYFY